MVASGTGVRNKAKGNCVENIESAKYLFAACVNFDPANLANGPKTEVAEFSMGSIIERDAIELPILPNIYGYTALDYCVPSTSKANCIVNC